MFIFDALYKYNFATNKDVNALLAEYLSYKDKYKETEDESGELENLILTDTPIEKAAK